MLFFKKQKTQIARLLHEMAARPDNFRIDRYVLRHLPSGTEYWIANGFNHYGLYVCGASHPYFHRDDKKRFHKALQVLGEITKPGPISVDLPVPGALTSASRNA